MLQLRYHIVRDRNNRKRCSAVAAAFLLAAASLPHAYAQSGSAAPIWGHYKLTAITSSASIQRELQDMWAVGGRCPRIDNDWTTAIDAAHAAGFTQMILISGGTMRSVPDTTTYANSTVALARAHPDAMIELGNECNLNGFSPQQYAIMAKAAYQAVKAAGLKNIILLGSVGNSTSTVGGLSMYGWCAALVANGCTSESDSIGRTITSTGTRPSMRSGGTFTRYRAAIRELRLGNRASPFSAIRHSRSPNGARP